MALTETQAKVLAVLAGLEPTQALTVRQLCGATGLSASTVRGALAGQSYAGLALGSGRSPMGWRITSRGRSVLSAALYRDFLGGVR